MHPNETHVIQALHQHVREIATQEVEQIRGKLNGCDEEVAMIEQMTLRISHELSQMVHARMEEQTDESHREALLEVLKNLFGLSI